MYSDPIGRNCTAVKSTNTSVFFYYTTYCSAQAATAIPTTAPSGPSCKPTTQPSAVPTKSPTQLAPTATPSSFKPTPQPSVAPSKSPTPLPTFDAYYFNAFPSPHCHTVARAAPRLPCPHQITEADSRTYDSGRTGHRLHLASDHRGHHASQPQPRHSDCNPGSICSIDGCKAFQCKSPYNLFRHLPVSVLHVCIRLFCVPPFHHLLLIDSV